MPTTYARAPDHVKERAAAIVDDHYPALKGAGVKVDYIFAHSSLDGDNQPTGKAIMVRGYQAAAYVRVLPLKERAMGRGDCEIVIDGDQYGVWPEKKADAILDHELCHLVPQLKEGAFIYDDLQRPKLRLRHHDRQFGWFDEIADRHGEAAVETAQARHFVEEAGQFYFEGFTPPKGINPTLFGFAPRKVTVPATAPEEVP